MPIPRKGGSAPPRSPSAAPSGGIPRKAGRVGVSRPGVEGQIPNTPAPAEESRTNLGWMAAGAGALALAGGVAARNPGMVGKGLSAFNAVRMQSMLSGFALPKSILGNVGAGIERAVEGKGTGALKQMFSKQTAKDFAASYKANKPPHPGITNLPGPMPGRLMGAMDDATRGSLQRGGASADEAQNAVLQTPLGSNLGKLGEALDSPTAAHVFPFRRTPFNQFYEGLRRLPGGSGGTTRGKIAYGTAGAAHGAATADDNTPISVPFAMAASARYGLPYGLAALIGRALAGGKGGGGIAGSALPVSEYGMESAVHPMKALPFVGKPAALTALEKLFGRD